jgi:hypothetical protein
MATDIMKRIYLLNEDYKRISEESDRSGYYQYEVINKALDHYFSSLSDKQRNELRYEL